MKIYKEWSKNISNENYQEFFTKYLELEKYAYMSILSKKRNIIEGKVSDIAKEYNMDNVTFAGFLDGINTSLEKVVELEELTEEDNIKIEINFEKLFYNMFVAKADWLYTLEEWGQILDTDEMIAIKKQYNIDNTATSNKVGRNEPCPCGSGKKYKKCCGK